MTALRSMSDWLSTAVTLVGFSHSALSPAAAAPSPTRWELGCDEPFGWVHGANDGLGEPDLVDDFVDQACWPFEPLSAAELRFDKDCVEKGPTVR